MVHSGVLQNPCYWVCAAADIVLGHSSAVAVAHIVVAAADAVVDSVAGAEGIDSGCYTG